MKQLKLISVCGLIATIAVMATWTPQARAAATAFDAACNDNGSNGTNGGTGFGAWSTTNGVAGGIYTTTDRTISNATCATAWGSFTGTNTTVATSQARPFTSANSTNAFQPGQQISVMMHNGGIATGGSEGLSLWNASNNGVLELVFDGGSGTWSINDSTGFHAASPSIPYAGNSVSGLLAVVRLTSSTTYSLTVTEPANRASGVQTVYGPYTGTLANPSGGQAITQLRFFTFADGSGNNLQFNNLNVSCPDTLAFTTQPASETVPTNASALFSANTFGDTVTHQWQSSPDGSAWTSIASGTNTYSITATNDESFLSVTATPANNNFQYRCIATDACANSATSGVATLTLSGATAVGITTQPANTAVCSNSPATFSVTASDPAAGYAWLQHSNTGWGAGNAWSVTASNAGSGVFIGSSTNNDSGTPACTGFGGNDINSPALDRALGMFGPVIKVLRQFPSTLSAGQWFSVDMDNGNVDTGAQNGFSLHTSSGAGDQILFSFYFLGGARNYKISDSTGEHDTGIRFTRTGLRIQMLMGPSVGGTNAYTLSFQTNQCGAATSLTNTFSGLFKTNGPAGAVLLFNNNGAGGSANDMYFNNIIAGAAYDNANNYSVGNWVGSNNGDLPISGANSSSFTINNAQSNNVAYYAIATNTAGAVISSTATVTINPMPTAFNVTGGGAYCDGGSGVSVTLSNSNAGITYYLELGGTNAVGSLAGTGSALMFSGVTGTGAYQILASNTTTGCTQSMNGTAAVTVNALPSSTITAPSSVCASTSVNSASVPDAGVGASYAWSIGNGTIDSGQGSTNISFTAGASGNVTISVSVTNSSGCSSNGGPVSVSITPLPGIVSGPTPASASACVGAPVSFSIGPAVGSTGFQWRKDGFPVSGLNISGANSPEVIIDPVGALDAGGYDVIVSGPCGSVTSAVATLTVNALPTATVSGDATICSGNSTVIEAALAGTAPWTITWSDGPTQSGITSNPATRTVSPTSTTMYTVTNIEDANCSGTSSGSATVTVNATPSAPTAGNNGPLLADSTLSLTASTVPSTVYNWTGPNSFASTNQNPSIANATSAASGTYSVTVTDTNGCTSAAGTTTALVTPLRITAVAKEGDNVRVTWLTTGGTTNALQATTGAPGYNTNFVDISGPMPILGVGDTSTNYLDISGATNSPAEFYRVRLVP